MRLPHRAIAVLAMLSLALPVLAGSDEARVHAGETIYREGKLISGKPLRGLAAAGVLREGAAAACVACHRRSGYGISEGNLVVRPIGARDLYQRWAAAAPSQRIAHQLGKPQRPPYDEAALARALRTGVDVSGRQMDSMMPRYQLGDADMAALQAYLQGLSALPDPAVDQQEIRLATVIQPHVAPARRRALLEVLQAFVQDKNAGARSELARRSAGAMRMQRAYRRWVLEVWELEGESSGWAAQLARRYRARPVFALVSGVGELGWQPIQDFSERFHVPCILPLTSLPGAASSNFYTVYFSRGIALEAEALAGQIGRQEPAPRVIQVYRRDDAVAAAAASAFRAAWPHASGRLEERALPGPADGALRHALAHSDAALVLWLRAPDLPGTLGETAAPGAAVYLSGTLLGSEPPPAAVGATISYPWELPVLRLPRVQRSIDWLRARSIGLDYLDDRVNALFAIMMLGEALAHIMDSFSRDYLVETIEHQVATTALASYFPPLTLGPDQRFASKGVYLVGVGADLDLHPLSDLIVPSASPTPRRNQ